MDLVLGLSLTSADVQWVLVEGTTAEGATIRRDAVDSDTLDDVVAAVGENRLHAVGVTWANEAESAASTLLDALAERGIDNVITVSEEEAADALAMGIAERGGYSEVAVCIVDPDNALVALVDADGVTTERVDPDDTLALLDRSGAQPEAIFVLGSADDIDSVAGAFHGAAVPVITAAEADLALARGAALASAQAVNTLEAQPARWRLPSRIGVLTSVLAAAVVVFVVSISVALGLRLTPGTDSTVAQRDTAATAEQPASVPAVPPVRRAVPKPVPAAPPPCAGSTASGRRATGCADDRRGRGPRTASGPGDRATRGATACGCSSARLCPPRRPHPITFRLPRRRNRGFATGSSNASRSSTGSTSPTRTGS